MIVQAILLLGAIICLSFLWVNSHPKNYPTGPRKLPILGNLLDLKKIGKGGLSGLFTDLAKIYGPVFSFDFASHRAVVLNDHKLIKEAWSNPNFCGRPRIIGAEERSDGKRRGILFNDGIHYNEQRRFVVRQLKEFGLGKRSMESLILDEIAILIKDFRKDVGKPISTLLRFNAAVLNAVWMIAVGDRINPDDPEVIKIFNIMQSSIASAGVAKPLTYISWLNVLLPKVTGWDEMKKNLPVLYDILWKISKPLLTEYNGDSPEYFAHAYIDQIRKCNDKDSSFYGPEGEKQFTTILRDLFEAGADTTSTTLSWLFLYMAVYPKVQELLCDEIDAVLNSRKPSIQDRYSMPYTEAAILETLRLSSIVHVGLWHRAHEDGHIGKYFIPKDTVLIPNLAGVHRDPAVWDQPDAFKPERFLSSEKTSVIKNPEGFFPFSVGKRVCPGETLAKDELFLFVTSIFQEFNVALDPSEPKPSLDRSNGIVAPPKPHNIVMTFRQKPKAI